MSRTRTLLQLRTRIRLLADTGPDGSDRHPDADVNGFINESCQALRELASDNGHQLYLKSTTGTMTAGVLAGFSFGTVPWPSDCVALYGVDVTVTANDIRSLSPTSFGERNEFRDMYGGATGIPVSFHVYNVGQEYGASITVGSIAILPAPDRAYPYALWYLPPWIDMTLGTDVFNGIAGWDDWVAWDCVMKLAAADNDMAQTAQIAGAERAKSEARVLKRANSVQRVGPACRRDIASRARISGARSSWRRPA